MGKPTLHIIENERAHRRVSVDLQGALCTPDKSIQLVRTKDISEGGIQLESSTLKRPALGTIVKLQLDGVISNGHTPKMDIYMMTVIHTSYSSIGLSFCKQDSV